MKCRACDYELWGIRPPGPCPECGRPFTPTDFRFRRRAVQFLCPHCSAPYQGLSDDGLPEPRWFRCVKCGGAVDVNEMPVALPEGAPSAGVMADEAPWPSRRRIGWRRAMHRTYVASLIRPSEVVHGLASDGGVWEAFRFALYVHLAVGLVYGVVFGGLALVIAGIGPGARGAGAAMIGSGFVIGAMIVFAALIQTLIVLPVYALVAHGLLTISGPRRGGLGLTLRTLYYGQGPMILNAVPICGGYVGPVWSVISSAVMIKEAQRVSGWRAALAAVLPPLIIIGAAIFLYVAFVLSLLSGSGAFAMSSPIGAKPSPLAGAIVAAAGPDGQCPQHVLSLAGAGGSVTSWMLIDSTAGGARARLPGPVSAPTPHALPDGSPLSSIDSLPPEAVASLASALTDSEPLYTLGDFIFCHRGVTVPSTLPQLWLGFSDPRAVGQPRGAVLLTVLLADGQEGQMVGLWSTLVEAQNALRSAAGLPPIPLVFGELPARTSDPNSPAADSADDAPDDDDD